jgi:lipopolysaccharide transport protein LptA
MKLIAPALFVLAASLLPAAEAFFPTSAATNLETRINSDTVDFDLKSRQAVYRGNVRVEDPRVNLTCDVLTARVPAEGKRVDSIIAESNVVILIPDKGITNRATAAKAIYTYQVVGTKTNETLELTGSPAVESPQGTMTGDAIIWDRGSDTIRATNQRMTYRPAPAASTNSAPTNTVDTSTPATP